MKSILTLVVVFCLLYSITYGQKQPSDFGFIHKNVIVEGDTINYYIYGTVDTLRVKKPLFLYLQGSDPYPLFYSNNGNDGYSLIFLPFKEISKRYHFVVISKPGVKFHSDIGDPPAKLYYEKLSLDYRVFMADNVINNCISLGFTDTSRIVVFGHSEGAQIAPKLAYTNKRVTHLVAMSGTGLNQMYDFIITIRKQYKQGELSMEQADKEIESLYQYYNDILNYPNSTDKFWEGHTYKRWSTTINNSPLSYLLKLDIPIYIAAGTADEAAPIENMDYIKIAFVQNRKTNLTYKYYWNYDHSYNELITRNGGVIRVNRKQEVIKELMAWLE